MTPIISLHCLRTVLTVALCFLSIPAVSTETISHFGISSGLVDISTISKRKSAIIFLQKDIKDLVGLTRRLRPDELQWLDEAPKKLNKLHPNRQEYIKNLLVLVSSEKYSLIEAHQKIDLLLRSIEDHTECALNSIDLTDESKCLLNLARNMWWLVNSYQHLNILRKSGKILTGEFSSVDYQKPDAFIYRVHLNATSINKLLEASAFSR